MFGLSLEKLVVLALIAALVLGPHRLPHYAHRLGELVRSLCDLLDVARDSARAEIGGELSLDEWRRLDPRRYHPRSLVREALADDIAPAGRAPADPHTSRESATPPDAIAPSVQRRPRYDSAGRALRTPL
ncbi:twin-arginine translocase TatA/TatE family subunit [Cnuibacter physcomitrellae]|uniref:twin-arginine translocase TatA/TatE family subunit n=1 Tax=Cnuibacter physcomitrellae TaxID=1619308 RepID=UPI002175AB09|nr:twin-arginine translocase TatA/TatE family subunit [Cnuibacter physcomitrellae]MCS5498534.1 twin-arginine translocase TatA/TatE family subunit [Cnuibacter physcomitrellae]